MPAAAEAISAAIQVVVQSMHRDVIGHKLVFWQDNNRMKIKTFTGLFSEILIY